MGRAFLRRSVTLDPGNETDFPHAVFEGNAGAGFETEADDGCMGVIAGRSIGMGREEKEIMGCESSGAGEVLGEGCGSGSPWFPSCTAGVHETVLQGDVSAAGEVGTLEVGLSDVDCVNCLQSSGESSTSHPDTSMLHGHQSPSSVVDRAGCGSLGGVAECRWGRGSLRSLLCCPGCGLWEGWRFMWNMRRWGWSWGHLQFMCWTWCGLCFTI